MHWTETLFLEHGALFLKVIRRADQRTAKDVELLERIFREMEVQQGDQILDLCCGYGRHAISLAEKGYLVTGVDLSPISIQYAKEQAKERHLQDRVTFLVGDAREVVTLLEEQQGALQELPPRTTQERTQGQFRPGVGREGMDRVFAGREYANKGARRPPLDYERGNGQRGNF